MIITIARECGCGGKQIGKVIAKELSYPLYDKEGLAKKAKEQGSYEELKYFFEETPVNSLLYAIAMGEGIRPVNDSMLEKLHNLVGEEDCVIIGRCGNFVFRNRKDLVSIFLHENKEKRIEKIKEKFQISQKEAKKRVEKTDHARSEFHKQSSEQIWGDSKEYSLSIDVELLGEEDTGKWIAEFIRRLK